MINKLERKYGRYAIRNLSKYIVICFAISYVLCYMFEDVYYFLVFSPYHIFVRHQIWRIFTWVFTIPESFNIFTLVMMFFYYSIGNSIEKSIGSFLYNLYVFGSLILTGIGALLVGAVQYVRVKDTIDAILGYGKDIDLSGMETILGISAEQYSKAYTFVSETYINGSHMTQYLLIGIFLGFALMYSDAVVLLYFVIPFKVSWLAYLDLALIMFDFVTNSNVYLRANIITYLLSFAIMYVLVRKIPRSSHRYGASDRSSGMKRRRREDASEVRGQVIQMPSQIRKHRCAICGRSEADGDELEFRFCSKCNGNYEYCNEHLYTHEHVK